jgi:hypothetical protein
MTVDAAHFRREAARARELAQTGDDIRLSRMLLEVALELDVEAQAIEAENAPNGQDHDPATPCAGILYQTDDRPDSKNAGPIPVEVMNLSISGAKFRIDRALTPGTQMTLELLSPALRLHGTIMSLSGRETAMVFDFASSADPGLTRLLRTEPACVQQRHADRPNRQPKPAASFIRRLGMNP